jgi:hypothetical protein
LFDAVDRREQDHLLETGRTWLDRLRWVQERPDDVVLAVAASTENAEMR